MFLCFLPLLSCCWKGNSLLCFLIIMPSLFLILSFQCDCRWKDRTAVQVCTTRSLQRSEGAPLPRWRPEGRRDVAFAGNNTNKRERECEKGEFPSFLLTASVSSRLYSLLFPSAGRKWKHPVDARMLKWLQKVGYSAHGSFVVILLWSFYLFSLSFFSFAFFVGASDEEKVD